MLLDVLSGLPELKVCTHYECDGERIDHFPSDAFKLDRCKPVLETIPGWTEDLTKVRSFGDLPPGARKYVERIRELVGLPVSIISVGPDRAQTIHL